VVSVKEHWDEDFMDTRDLRGVRVYLIRVDPFS